MPDFQTLDDLSLHGQKVLLRADLNVPMKNEAVTDATRLIRLLPTLEDLIARNAKIIILSHFGRPDGKKDAKYSLRPVAAALEGIAGRHVAFAEDCIGPIAQKAIDELENGQILVLENTRFYPGEEKNDLAFSKELAKLGDVYINDAFSAAHRAHASTTGLAKLLPAAAGRLMQEELMALSKALENPTRPVAALVGGSKISTKLDLLHNLIKKVDLLVLGGGMANTFMAAKGLNVGKSLYEADMLETARTISAEAEARACRIILPKDVVVAAEMKERAEHETVTANGVPSDKMIFDIGPASVIEISETLALCKTVIWNGPLGVFEIPPFDAGTNAVAKAVVALTREGKILSVAGGGDTVAALAHARLTDGVSYLSTAGGAFLEWLEGKELPGITALSQKTPV